MDIDADLVAAAHERLAACGISRVTVGCGDGGVGWPKLAPYDRIIATNHREIIVALRDRFRCIAPDYLGFGLSERPSGFGYRIEEHAQVVGALVDHLGLDGYLTMGQDWGGPISMAVDTARADRVRGVVLGNTWFWPADDLQFKAFSRVMGSFPMQWAILQRNFFVERLIPAGTATSLSPDVMAHYRGGAAQRRGPRGRGADAQRDPRRPAAAGAARAGRASQAGVEAHAAGVGHEGRRFQARPQHSANADGVLRSHPRRTTSCEPLNPGRYASANRRGDHRPLRLA